MTHRELIVAGTLFLSWAVPASAQGGSASFRGLGHMPGGQSSEVLGVSADGTTAVGYGDSESSDPTEAFRWTRDEGMVGLGDLPGGEFNSTATGVSADGSVIVGWGVSGVLSVEGFRWTRDDGMVGLADLPGGSAASFAYGVSRDGRVVVGAGSAESSDEALRWAPLRPRSLGQLAGGNPVSLALSASADGSVIVGMSSSSASDPQLEAFRWTPGGGMVGLGDLAGGLFDSSASAVSSDGSVLVGHGFSASGPEAFRWTEGGGMVGLGDLPGGEFFSQAFAVSADGSVVVGHGVDDPSGLVTAFVWDAGHGMRSLHDVLVNDYALDLTGWTIGTATGISADGLTIVGNASNPAGKGEAWIATLPETAFAPAGP